MSLFGYARVSTRDQDLAAQDAELMAASCAKVFKKKNLRCAVDRPELAKVIRRLEPGDVLMGVRPDRLARSTSDTTCSTRSASAVLPCPTVIEPAAAPRAVAPSGRLGLAELRTAGRQPASGGSASRG